MQNDITHLQYRAERNSNFGPVPVQNLQQIPSSTITAKEFVISTPRSSKKPGKGKRDKRKKEEEEQSRHTRDDSSDGDDSDDSDDSGDGGGGGGPDPPSSGSSDSDGSDDSSSSSNNSSDTSPPPTVLSTPSLRNNLTEATQTPEVRFGAYAAKKVVDALIDRGVPRYLSAKAKYERRK